MDMILISKQILILYILLRRDDEYLLYKKINGYYIYITYLTFTPKE